MLCTYFDILRFACECFGIARFPSLLEMLFYINYCLPKKGSRTIIIIRTKINVSRLSVVFL